MKTTTAAGFAQLLLVMFCLTQLALITHAQSDERRVAQTLSAAGVRSLSEARELINADNFDAAYELLDRVTRGRSYSNYDKAKAWQLIAFVYINREDYSKAIAAHEAARELKALELRSELESLYSLANLHAYQENYVRSIHYLELWFERSDSPDAQAYFTGAQVYALANHLAQARDFAERGMQAHRQYGGEPRETWYRLLLALYLQLGDFAQGSRLLEEMLSYWPGRLEYFNQLGALYREQERDLDALAVMSLAQQNNLVEDPLALEPLLQMYRYNNYPYKGAALFDAALADESDSATLKQLGDAYGQAREWPAARQAYLRAAQKGDDGQHWLIVCQTAYRDGEWSDARRFCGQALARGGLDNDEGYAWQILAMAHYQSGDNPAAAEAFHKCQQWARLARECGQWRDHLSRQMERETAEAHARQVEEARLAREQEAMREAVNNRLQERF